jgi:hypothetical protein
VLVFLFHGETLIRDLIIVGIILMLTVVAVCFGLVRLFFWYRSRKKRRAL